MMNKITLSIIAGALGAVALVVGVWWWETKDDPPKAVFVPYRGPAQTLYEENMRLGGWFYFECGKPVEERITLAREKAGVRVRLLPIDVMECLWSVRVLSGEVRIRYEDNTSFDWTPSTCPKGPETDQQCTNISHKVFKQMYSLAPESVVEFKLKPRFYKSGPRQ
jgi:hypothetical protein